MFHWRHSWGFTLNWFEVVTTKDFLESGNYLCAALGALLWTGSKWRHQKTFWRVSSDNFVPLSKVYYGLNWSGRCKRLSVEWVAIICVLFLKLYSELTRSDQSKNFLKWAVVILCPLLKVYSGLARSGDRNTFWRVAHALNLSFLSSYL